MPAIFTILSCLWIGQLTVAEEQAIAPAEPMQAISTDNDSAAALRKRPPEMIAQAMALPSGSVVTGQPLTLTQALSVSADRRLQLALAQTYWQTVEAVAKYHYCLEQFNRIDQLSARREETALFQAAHAAAMAELREAELAAGSSQHELAGLLQLPADAPLPLPANQPHVGTYKTNFQELYAQRPAPDRARLIDRTLPIRRMAIDQRAVAVQAAEDALSAAVDSYQAGRRSLRSVVFAGEQLLREQRAFVETVCRYNRNIAEYAMIVAPPGATHQTLVAYMIKTTREPGQTPSAADQRGVQPAGLNQPIPAPVNRQLNDQPSVAPLQPVPEGSVIPATEPETRRDPFPAPRNNEPTLAPPRPDAKPKTDNESAAPDAAEGEEKENIRYSVGDPFSRRVQVVKKSPVELAAADATDSADQNSEANSSEPEAGQTVPDAAGIAAALYPALVEATPAVRAKQLTLALHWDRTLPEGIGRPLGLEECLAKLNGADRYGAVEAFWIARQRAAEYQVLAQEIDFLENLRPLVLERRTEPEGPSAMLDLRAVRRSVMADIEDAEAALIEAQFDLALRTQSVAEGVWPLPATVPHTGRYLLNLEAQAPAFVHSWPTRRLSAAIPAFAASVQEHAAAVVAADVARTKALEQYLSGNLPLEEALAEVRRQTQQTFTFLQTLTDYNRTIAQYALAVLPPDASPAKIASALVVQR